MWSRQGSMARNGALSRKRVDEGGYGEALGANDQATEEQKDQYHLVSATS